MRRFTLRDILTATATRETELKNLQNREQVAFAFGRGIEGPFGSLSFVEVDPTWGLMDRVDATHLRFDGDAFASYAMLNQLDLEITSARRVTADFQRDPRPNQRQRALRFSVSRALGVARTVSPGASTT